MGAGEVRKPWQQPGEGRRPSDLAKGVPSGIIQSRSPRRAAAVPGHHRGQDGPRPISTESSLSGQGSQKATETQARATCSWCQEGTNGAEWRLAFLGAHGGLAGEVALRLGPEPPTSLCLCTCQTLCLEHVSFPLHLVKASPCFGAPLHGPDEVKASCERSRDTSHLPFATHGTSVSAHLFLRLSDQYLPGYILNCLREIQYFGLSIEARPLVQRKHSIKVSELL